jgi:hypothetical protein
LDALASELLTHLLRIGERHEAGTRSRAPALTEKALAPYRSLKQLDRKEAVEAVFRAARSKGTVGLHWDEMGERYGGFIRRVDLLDPPGLARFLNQKPASELRANAREVLAPFIDALPVLSDVLAHWNKLRTVRGTKPSDVDSWRDAAIAIQKARDDFGNASDYRPLRNFSAQVFQDSKRVESIIPQIDVLLAGSIQAPPREASEVWGEIGLAREEHPVRLAGRVSIVRDRVTALLDAPYGAFPVATVRAVAASPAPLAILTIENLTTFHQEANRGCDTPRLVIYTGGAPSPAWRAMYARLLESAPRDIPVRHWGDVDEGGFRIAAQIAKVARASGRPLEAHRMSPGDVPEAQRRPASRETLERMQHLAREAGWQEIALAIDVERGFTAEQESLD